MPKNDVSDEDLLPSSSSTENQDDLAVTNDTEGDATSSTATGAEGEAEGALDIVRDVVADREPDPASPAAGSEDGENPGEAASENAEGTDDYADVPFNKHPRFQQLVQERNTLRGDAQRYQNVQNFLDQSGLTSDEAADGLTIMAQAKVDPAGAWQKIKPWVQQLLLNAGEVLPEDLRERVTSGAMSEEAAFEVSRSRAKVNSVAAQRSFDEQRQQRRQSQEVAQTLYDTAVEWEAERQKRDPHFAAKSPLVQREIAWLQSREGKPKTAEGVKAQLKKAYDNVNKSFVAPRTPAAGRQAAKPAMQPVRSGAVQQPAAQKPKNTLDIVRAHTAARRQAK